MYIDNLIFEVTRKCNMKCRHCLRGKAENISMSAEVIKNALKDVSDIGTLQFTGGEPTLALYQIRTIFKVIKENNISVGWIWLKSNGMIFSQALINYFADFQEYVDEPEMSALEFSTDQFHTINNKSMGKYYNLSEYYKWIHISHKKPILHVIKEGRAKKFIDRVVYHKPKFYSGWPIPEEYMKERYSTIAYEYPVYISSNGNVICGCDLSFKHIDSYSFGNVNKTPLKEIISSKIQSEVQNVFV